jgi:hypothetical protein
LNIQHFKKIKFINFLPCLWVIFFWIRIRIRIGNPDTDPGTPLNPDPIRNIGLKYDRSLSDEMVLGLNMLTAGLKSPLLGELERMGGETQFHDISVVCEAKIRLTCSSVFLAAGQS